MTGRLSAFALDQFVAPKCSALTACLAPELPEPYDYLGSFLLNNILIRSYPEKGRTLAIVFLRRLVNATWAYRGGRDQMLRCVCAKPSNEMIPAYLNSHFESAIVNTCLALRAHDALGRLIDPAEKCSEAQELIDAYDALRHFDDRIKSRPITADFTAPVWLVDDGIEFAGEKRKGAKLQKLRFDELADILRKLDSDAHLMAVDVFC
jgi:hypothetical protein